MIAFLESALIPLPIDFFMMPLILARPGQAWLVAAWGALGSILGGVFGYLFGLMAYETVGAWLISSVSWETSFSEAQNMMSENGWMAVVLAGITPLPFNAATIAAGATAMRFDLFLAAVIGVRAIRFALLAVVFSAFREGLSAVARRAGWKIAGITACVIILSAILLPLAAG